MGRSEGEVTFWGQETTPGGGNDLRRRSHAGEVEGRVSEEEEPLGEVVGGGCSEEEEPLRGGVGHPKEEGEEFQGCFPGEGIQNEEEL